MRDQCGAQSIGRRGAFKASFTSKMNQCFVLLYLLRAKLFRGKKLHGDYDIRVEQVRFTLQTIFHFICFALIKLHIIYIVIPFLT